MSLLDEMINEIFGFHFLEPYSTFEEQIKVRPVINKLPPRPEPSLLQQQNGSGSSARPKRLAPLVASNKDPPSSLVQAVEQ